MTIWTFGQSGRVAAADKAGAASAVASAQATIHRRVEIRQDGSIQSDVLGKYEMMQVTEQKCDPETGSIEEQCVFLIYEMQ